MTVKKSRSYGRWPSLVTPEYFGNLLEFSEPSWGLDGSLFWRERISSLASIQQFNPKTGEILSVSADLNISGGLLYGGGSFTPGKESLLVFDKISHQLYKIDLRNNAITQLTSNLQKSASPKISPDGKNIIFVHSDGENDLISIQENGLNSSASALVSQSDFYNYPRWHPDGNQIAWISWNHPHMPWESSVLRLGSLDFSPGKAPQLIKEHIIAGGEQNSILQPEFSPDGEFIAYISDEDGWWQLYLHNLSTNECQQLTKGTNELGLPPWLQDQRSYGFTPDGQRIVFLRNQEGFRSLWCLDLARMQETQIQLDENYTWFEGLAISPLGDQIALIASAGDLPPRLITVDLEGNTRIIRRSTQDNLPRKLFSLPKPISWISSDGRQIYGLFYVPQNSFYSGNGEPPLLVIIHSGPTRQKWAEFQPRTQYFTSRGYAVLEVNYRGSTGYGRDYQQAIQGEWGVVDVEDCLTGANYVTKNGWADRKKMALLGSSSGGLTVYQTLVKYPGVFRAGISLYGIANHLTLLENPPKFERYYSEWLIGPYPEAKDLYQKRSPIFFADKIQDPVAVFQGGKDPIIPQDQADQIVQALKDNHIPVEYHLYPEEGHSFKQSETLLDFYQKSELFLSKYVLGEG